MSEFLESYWKLSSLPSSVVQPLNNLVDDDEAGDPIVINDPNPVQTSIRALEVALAAATTRLMNEMVTGKPQFGVDGMRTVAGRLITQLSKLTDFIDKHPRPPDPNFRHIPPCPECKAKAGEHWAHDCPKLNRFGRDCTYDYRKGQPVFYDQIRPLAEPLKPNRYDRFSCIVCHGVWAGINADQLVKEGNHLGPEWAKLYKVFREECLG